MNNYYIGLLTILTVLIVSPNIAKCGNCSESYPLKFTDDQMDLDCNGYKDIADLIYALKVLSGQPLLAQSDINGDLKFGIEECLLLFKAVSGLYRENLVSNGDFKREDLLPWVVSEAERNWFHTENQELVITLHSEHQTICQPIQILPGKRYEVTFAAKTGLENSIMIGISDNLLTPTSFQVSELCRPKHNNWHLFSFEFEYPSEISHASTVEVTLDFSFNTSNLNEVQILRVDNIHVKRVQVEESGTNAIVAMWGKYVSPIISNIDVTSSTSLYETFTYLMFPIEGVYQLNIKKPQNELVRFFSMLIQKLPYLEGLRKNHANGELLLDAFFLDENRSGFGQRRILPITDNSGTIFFNPLVTLQFSYVISHLTKQIILNNEFIELTNTEHSFLRQSIPFLYYDIVSPLYLEVEARWYESAGGPYPNIKEKILAKLNYKSSIDLQKKSYFRAITDEELFLFAIAADLKYIDKKYSGLFSLDDGHLLDEICDYTYEVLNQRLSSTEGSFYFDIGAWDEHPDFAYASYEESLFPDKTYPATNCVPDSSHSHRWPWWLRSYRDAYHINSVRWIYYENLIKALSDQLSTHVIEWTETGPLLKNYMDGRNGWYRVNDEWGYGPYTLSATAKYGSWYLLGEWDDRINQFSRAIAGMLRSEDPRVIDFRTKFYGQRDYTQSVDPGGLRSIDELQKSTIFELIILLGEKMVLFRNRH